MNGNNQSVLDVYESVLESLGNFCECVLSGDLEKGHKPADGEFQFNFFDLNRTHNFIIIFFKMYFCSVSSSFIQFR